MGVSFGFGYQGFANIACYSLKTQLHVIAYADVPFVPHPICVLCGTRNFLSLDPKFRLVFSLVGCYPVFNTMDHYKIIIIILFFFNGPLHYYYY